MCGRYKLHRSDKAILAEKFKVREEDVFDPDDDELDNAPGSWRTVVGTKGAERILMKMRWGFQMQIQGKSKLVFNTKSEDVLDSKLWKPKFTSSRCIIPASGFYEWKKINGKTGPKFDVTVPGQSLFGFAGVWGNWTNPKTSAFEKTFSIFTTVPNELFAAYHNRQPVILDPSECDEWLAPGERPPEHLLRILPEEKMVITPVGPPAVLADEGPLQESLFG
jgi:putative SOS response-associated peptidase YedK